jgi:hypothetical protein
LEHSDQAGVDVIITIFCDFHHLSAKLEFFLKIDNVMIHFSQNSAVFLSHQAHISSPIFWRKYFLNNNIGSCFGEISPLEEIQTKQGLKYALV